MWSSAFEDIAFFISTLLCSRVTWKQPLPVIPVFYTLASQDWASCCFFVVGNSSRQPSPTHPCVVRTSLVTNPEHSTISATVKKINYISAKTRTFFSPYHLSRLTTSSPWLLDDESSKGLGGKDWDTTGFEALRGVLRLCGCGDAEGGARTKMGMNKCLGKWIWMILHLMGCRGRKSLLIRQKTG